MDRVFALLFFVLLAASGALIVETSVDLPPQVASHFVRGGIANGWQSLQSYRAVMLGFGVGLPLILAGLMALRAPATYGYGLGALIALLMVGVHLEVVEANLRTPARLDESHFFVLMVAFGAGLLALIVVYMLRSRQ